MIGPPRRGATGRRRGPPTVAAPLHPRLNIGVTVTFLCVPRGEVVAEAPAVIMRDVRSAAAQHNILRPQLFESSSGAGSEGEGGEAFACEQDTAIAEWLHRTRNVSGHRATASAHAICSGRACSSRTFESAYAPLPRPPSLSLESPPSAAAAVAHAAAIAALRLVGAASARRGTERLLGLTAPW